ncbi:Lissencephaly-1 homolog [Gryllus bimaculatus]|nr:Lissencephaly-1 homolog [Gryllus bimaculatus]
MASAPYKLSCVLYGHTLDVRSIAVSQEGYIVSGSRDKTAKIWKPNGINAGYTEVQTLLGHTNFVSCVCVLPPDSQFPKGLILTGSNDSNIRMFAVDSPQPIAVLKGHKNVGHQMAVWSSIQLASGDVVTGSADKSIKIWLPDGICQKTLTGGAECFVTSGEDRTVRVWHGGEVEQTVTLPAQSVWTVACLANGDIVTGSSDGVIRVFSCDVNRQADSELLQQFEEQVASTGVNAEQELGGVKVSDLPGKEVLSSPGIKDGQTKLIREGSDVHCYSWSAADGKWEKVGDVVGASGGSQSTSGKVLYNGKEYDYVFSVDIEDGKPPLKLPYNSDEDPWFAAQKFIHENNLSQLFLDQVANFIVNNSKKITTASASTSTSSYCDPFTGGSRYIPGNETARGNGPAPTGLDPFTEKLTEFNRRTGDGNHKVDEIFLEGVVKLGNLGEPANLVHVQILKQLLEWPQDILFPVLDVTRLAVRNEEVNKELCSGETGNQMFSYLQKFLVPGSSSTNQMLTLRILSNMLAHPSGEQLVLNHRDYILSALSALAAPFNKHMQVAIATLLLNLAVTLERVKNKGSRSHSVQVTAALLPLLSDAEAQFRTLVTLGTLLWEAEDSETQLQLIGLVTTTSDVLDVLNKLVHTEINSNVDQAVQKVSQCAVQIVGLIQK